MTGFLLNNQNDVRYICFLGFCFLKVANVEKGISLYQKAAKLNKNVTYIVASSNSIPFMNNYFDLLIYIFAPIFINETKRVLKENGNIIIVTPGPDHLYELKEIMYKNPYHNDDRSNQFDNYELSKQRLKYSKTLDNTSINDLIKMTPYNYKTNSKDIENISIDKLSVTFDFIINIYKPNN